MTKQGLERLKQHEGFRSTPYLCTAGKLTVGYGCNLESNVHRSRIGYDGLISIMKNGMTEVEATEILLEDVKVVEDPLRKYSWFSELEPHHQDVLINMCYQMGLDTVKKFPSFIKYLRSGDYKRATMEMKYRNGRFPEKGKSKYYTDTPNRVDDLIEVVLSGYGDN